LPGVFGSSAKITRPHYRTCLVRKRLIQRLSGGDCPVTWISGPAGCGKTTLIGSYLDSVKSPVLWYRLDPRDADPGSFFMYLAAAAEKASRGKRSRIPPFSPEYLMSVEDFSRRFFEAMYHRLRKGTVVIFDDFQEVPADTPFHGIFLAALDAITEGIRIIVGSRTSAPAPFTRLVANGMMDLVGWRELSLTPEETRDMIELYGRGDMTDDELETIHRAAGGWAAGVKLMMEGMREGKVLSFDVDGLRHQNIFDYFAGEIFFKTGEAERNFLLMTALMPDFSVAMAAELTGDRRAGEILGDLERKNYFLERSGAGEGMYRYHPLFRNFLLSAGASMLNGDELRQRIVRAGAVLDDAGNIEAAIELYLDACEWQLAEKLMLDHARAFLRHGRTGLLKGWLDRIPEDRAEKSPWLLYWKGACRLGYDFDEARRLLKQAYEAFSSSGDVAGTILSTCGIIDACMYQFRRYHELDEWLDVLDDLLRGFGKDLPPDLELSVVQSSVMALVFRRPESITLRRWRGKIGNILLSMTDARSMVSVAAPYIHWFAWMGDLASARRLKEDIDSCLEDAMVSPMSLSVYRLAGLPVLWLASRFEEALEEMRDYIAFSRENGLLHGIFHATLQQAYCHIGLGDIAEARSAWKECASVLDRADINNLAQYYYVGAIITYHEDDLRMATRYAQEALTLAHESGTPFPLALTRLFYAMLLREAGEKEEAAALLEETEGIAAEMQSEYLFYVIHFLHAWWSLDDGRLGDVRRHISRACSIGVRTGLNNIDWWPGGMMARLCSFALDEGIEPDYVRDMINMHRLHPPRDVPVTGEWPWPVRISGMGTLEILCNGEPLSFSGKAQRKPFEMMKVLLASGGSEVPEGLIADALWPDADGDRSHRSFETTLYRLRRLIGVEGAILLQDGKLSLNPDVCFVDIWALESALSSIETVFASAGEWDGEKSRMLIDRILRLYRGDFLQDDPFADSRVAGKREALRLRLLGVLEKYGAGLEARDRWEEAVAIYLRGLDVDDLAEIFYQRLMVCYSRMGRRAEAVSAYNRCAARLRDVLGIAPSRETLRLRDSLLQ